MKYFKLILFLSLMPLFSTGQSIDRWVIAGAGDYSEAGGISLSYTVGEVAVESASGHSLILTQGFQQSKLAVVGLNIPEIGLSINAYPNPTASSVVLELETDQALGLEMKILNMQGQLIDQQFIKINGQYQQKIDFSSLAAGVYLLHLSGPEGNVETIKIKKID